jgi:hypothetical protein
VVSRCTRWEPKPDGEVDLADDLLIEEFGTILLDGIKCSADHIIGEIGCSNVLSEKTFQGFVLKPTCKQVEATVG